MNYRDINQLNSIILSKLFLIPKDIDLIVGVPRSGMLPANLLALYLNKPYTDLDSFLNGKIYSSGERLNTISNTVIKNVLIVDDSVASGKAIHKCKEQMKPFVSKFNIKYCAIYVVPGMEKLVDFVFELVPCPRYFQWNIFNHSSLRKACFDIDGVLCVDPTEAQNDDGQKYVDFVLNATPLYLPKFEIGMIVTSRLEKYRRETEIWLDKHHIKYKELVMLNLKTMEERQRINNHGLHKAQAYEKSKSVLFIESSLQQAVEINRITGKPVFCTENFQMIFKSQSIIYNIKSGKYLPFVRKYGLKARSILMKMLINLKSISYERKQRKKIIELPGSHGCRN